MNKQIHLACVSDIHLGHRNNDAPFIINNLNRELDNETLSKLDYLFLAGDVFDGLLQRPDEHSMDIDMWVADLLWRCKNNNVKLRVLEGTKSHDWHQSQIFVAMNEGAKIDCDLQFIDNLSIIYEAEHDVNILYVPDEWRPNTQDTYDEVLELMKSKGLEQVDFAIMHGQFEYQLPEIVKAPKHSSSKYLSIVKHLVFIGHVHVFSQFDRIIAQGSFDRLSHGEEGPKGYVKAVVYENGDYEAVFVENKHSRKYITIECSGLALEDTLSEINDRVDSLPDYSFVRVSLQAGHPLLENMHELVVRWPTITWSKIRRDVKEDEQDSSSDVLDEVDFIPITITKDNVSNLLLTRIQQRGVSMEMMSLVESAINALR